MDEFHFYADPDRGWAWQVPLLELPRAQFVLMSATLGDVTRFEADLTRRTGRPTAAVTLGHPPGAARLRRTGSTPLHETHRGAARAPTRRPSTSCTSPRPSAVERAQSLMSINVCTREEKDRHRRAHRRLPLRRRVRQDAVAASCATASACTTPACSPSTAGWWSGWPRPGCSRSSAAPTPSASASTCPSAPCCSPRSSKYDGTKTRHLSAREFHQIAGRAGRAGFDTAGHGGGPGPRARDRERARRWPRRATTRRSAARWCARSRPSGFVSWGEPTFERLVAAAPEPLTSSFAVSPLDAAQRARPARRRLRAPCAACSPTTTSPGPAQRRHIRRAIAIYRSLLAAGVVERLDAPDDRGPAACGSPSTSRPTSPSTSRCRRSPSPPSTCSTATSPDLRPRRAVGRRGRRSTTPAPVLAAQLDQGQGRGRRRDEGRRRRVRGAHGAPRRGHLPQAAAPSSLDGRLRRSTGRCHPWVADHPLAPKSVARDLYERAMTFADYVSHYSLARSEGLRAALPDRRLQGASSRPCPRTPRPTSCYDLTEWLGELVRQVDSSLLDEWERLRHPDAVAVDGGRPPRSTTRRRRSPPTAGRSGSWCATSCSAGSSWPRRRRYDELGELDGDAGWTAERWRRGARRRTSPSTPSSAPAPDARGAAAASIDEEPGRRGRSARSSTTPPATTTGASPPRSTSPPPTRPAPPCASPPSTSSDGARLVTAAGCGRNLSECRRW